MELNEVLSIMDATSANLEKLERVWSRAQTMLPKGPSLGTSIEYEDLCRDWIDLLPGLPEINGWTITTHLPRMEEVGQRYLDEFSSGEIDIALVADIEKPGVELAQYRHRLNKARRKASSERLGALEELIDTNLPKIISGIPRTSQEIISKPEVDLVENAFKEIDRLLGDATDRRGQWGNLFRHLAFGQGIDWHDILEYDWPSVKGDVAAARYSEKDPIPVPKVDIGELASSSPTGRATTSLNWTAIDPAGFERLIYDLFKSFQKYQNVQWLTNTNAPDRGRDLSAELVLDDGTGSTRTDRIIIQAKHWHSKSVGVSGISTNLANMKLWEPPTIRTLIVITSGFFSTDAVDWVEKHNAGTNLPTIDLWSQSRIENLLAQRPHLIAAHGLGD